ncbi:MAG: hypothetical protein ABR559_08705 [Gemmatimonadota bacterium]
MLLRALLVLAGFAAAWTGTALAQPSIKSASPTLVELKPGATVTVALEGADLYLLDGARVIVSGVDARGVKATLQRAGATRTAPRSLIIAATPDAPALAGASLEVTASRSGGRPIATGVTVRVPAPVSAPSRTAAPKWQTKTIASATPFSIAIQPPPVASSGKWFTKDISAGSFAIEIEPPAVAAVGKWQTKEIFAGGMSIEIEPVAE